MTSSHSFILIILHIEKLEQNCYCHHLLVFTAVTKMFRGQSDIYVYSEVISIVINGTTSILIIIL